MAWADPKGGGGPDSPFLAHVLGFLTLGPKLDPLLDLPFSKILDPPLVGYARLWPYTLYFMSIVL